MSVEGIEKRKWLQVRAPIPRLRFYRYGTVSLDYESRDMGAYL